MSAMYCIFFCILYFSPFSAHLLWEVLIIFLSIEASLGMMSGAQAKKEMERSRSSYFKKK